MRTRHRALTALAMASLVALPLAACGDGSEENPNEAATQEAPPSQDPADATPQERIEASFVASDAAAAEGWEDTSYIDEFYVPALAERQRASDAGNAETGATVTGATEFSNWSVVDESVTTAVVEFCQNSTGLKATKNGDPVEIENQNGETVGRFTLVRQSGEEPWMIQEQAYYEEGTQCATHFGD